MSLQSSGGFFNIVGFDETLDCYSLKRPFLFRKFLKELNENQLWRKLADVAIEKRILQPRIISKINNSSDGALYLINEFKRLNVTVGLLYKCLTDNEFQHLPVLLGLYEKIHVTKQPGEPNNTPFKTWSGGEIALTFLVKGCPVPSYQWFHNGIPLHWASDSSIQILNFSQEKEGKYHCIAVQSSSKHPQVSLISDTVECVLIIHVPHLLMDLPPEIVCVENEEVKLYVEPDNDFHGSYEWMRSNEIICRTNTLYIKHVTKHHEGKYRCVLKNSAGETYSNFCDLKVEVPLKIQAKVALLIGNSNYANLSSLKTPSADVILLSRCLKKLGFFVVSLINLNVNEFRNIFSWFYSIIPKKAVVFFFFSGHGFELANNKFLLPVDCPPSNCYRISDCVCYQFIIQQLMIRKPLLLISVLDMCLKGPNRTNNPRLYDENIKHYDYDLSNSSFIEACATSDYQLAYENSSYKTGLYCNCLCRRIIQDLPIVKNFEQAHEDFVKSSKCNQSPQLKYNNGQNDFKLNTRPLRGLTRMENKIIRSLPQFFIVNLKNIGVYLLFVFVPHELILNSMDIFILPLSDIVYLKFNFSCLKANFNHSGVMNKENESLPCSKLTIDGLQKIEDMMIFYFQCCTFCDINNIIIEDFAEIRIKPPLTFCQP